MTPLMISARTALGAASKHSTPQTHNLRCIA
jgi:hypothetical protein